MGRAPLEELVLLGDPLTSRAGHRSGTHAQASPPRPALLLRPDPGYQVHSTVRSNAGAEGLILWSDHEGVSDVADRCASLRRRHVLWSPSLTSTAAVSTSTLKPTEYPEAPSFLRPIGTSVTSREAHTNRVWLQRHHHAMRTCRQASISGPVHTDNMVVGTQHGGWRT